jgi:ABC-type transport system substrate-binding protein
LIDAGRAELDWTKRAATWRALHRRLYEMQPYLVAYNPPRKFVMNKALRGFQSFGLDPNYSLRRWYYAEGAPGTRAQPEKQ